jgi:electron transfer flavoprotein-quinone oxidoreductase
MNRLGLLKKKKVAGVVIDGGEKLYSDLVILAEGSSAFLTEKAGLRGKLEANSFTLYVKEVISLPRGVIEDRFNLEKEEGSIIGIIGYPASGAIGKGGIWVNRDTISIVVGGYLNQLVDKGLSPYHLLTRFKQHPLIQRLLEGGKVEEYQAHTIPKGGYKNIPKLNDYGLLVAGDAAMMISGRRGTDLAMITGKYAGETASQAWAKGDFSPEILSAYKTRINNSFFMENIKKGKDAKKYFEKYSDADFLITKTLNNIAREYFKVELTSENEKREKILKDIKIIQPFFKTINDFYHGFNNWGVL